MKRLLILILILPFFINEVKSQDLMDMLAEGQEETTEFARAGFKTTRVINSHSFESTAAGVLDVKISHRFGFLNQGAYELFGLDNATMRMGVDYGVTEHVMIGLGRSTVAKTYDGFIKVKFLRQSSGKRTMPITLAAVSGIANETLKFADPNRQNFYTSRLSYFHQIIIGRKFSDGFSFQLMPTLVHRNIVPTPEIAHDVLALGAAGRIKLTKRLALNAEYYYVLPDQMDPMFRNSLSIGFDIETGGHVFQLHFTNSTAMNEKGFITETVGNWGDGDIHFGFNISRVFTIVNPNRKR